METDSNADSLEDELKFQNQVMQKVVQQLPGASYFKRPDSNKRNIEEEEAFLTELESLVKDFEKHRATSTDRREPKTLEQYSIDDFQEL